ncbi:Integrase, catalytic core protein [Phytophthora megakarya]|uniref:Integrase, catalytic core protein n=1 Tax=Phytophthora megakarya TaxID=4795 RepID=A0A225VGX0_9STRA|nr:Integrase, catalytic core protein [Phytophthora megakarya]
MTTSHKKAEVVLGSDNNFQWEFTMRMTLARKGLLVHVQMVKDPAVMTEAWLHNDMKALGLIVQRVSIERHTKIRSATSAVQACNTLLSFYNRTTMHNRVTMTRRLHEFKMEDGSTMARHLGTFGELIVGLQTLDELLDDSRQLIIRLSSLPAEYGLIVSIVKNSKDVTLIEAKEKLLKEYERQEKKESSECALKATSFGGKGKNGKFGKKQANGGSHEDSVFAVGEDRSAGWLIDSGATAHMTPHRDDLYEFSTMPADMYVTIAAGKKIRIAGTGSVRLKGIDGKSIRMVEVLHVPGFDRRLLSVGKLGDRGMSVEFQRNSCVISNESKVIASGKKYGKAYELDCHQDTAHDTDYAEVDSEWELWHARMGHLNEDSLEKTLPVTTERIKCLHSDNGIEFENKSIDKICQQSGIIHQKTIPCSPQQNGVTERIDRTIMENARSMLHYKGVSAMWWVEVVNTAVYLINRSTNCMRSTTTLYELSFKTKPSRNHLRVFRSIGYAHVDKFRRTKLEAKSFKCMFLGYAEDSKGYRVYDLESNKVNVSRSEKLDERQVNGIYNTTTAEDSTIIYVTKDVEGSALPQRMEQPAADEPMDSVGEEAVEDVEMQVEFEASPGQELTTYRRVAGSTMDENKGIPPGTTNNDDPDNDDHFWPPSPTRPRFDEDSLLTEAVLAYAADVGDADDAPTTYQQVVVALEYVMEQLDVDTTFLNSKLKERVYMDVPYGISDDMNMMCRLDKTIYGLKQAASAWHKTIHRIFVEIGFRSCGADECVYVKVKEGRYVYICLYVEDMIIAAKTTEEIQEVKPPPKSAFKMMSWARLMTHQQDAKMVVNPCEERMKLTKTQSPKTGSEISMMQAKPYRALIGCQQHWKAAICVLRYLKGTRDLGFVYNGNKGKVELTAYTDVDWGSNLDDRRSVSGISRASVVFKSKYQRTVALSQCTQEVLFTRAMLKDLGHEQVGTTQVLEDD